MTPYQYAYNNPGMLNDPMGDVVDLQKEAYYAERNQISYNSYDYREAGMRDAEDAIMNQSDADFRALLAADQAHTDAMAAILGTLVDYFGENGPNKLQAAKMASAVYMGGDSYHGDLNGYSQIHEDIQGVVWNNKASGFKSALFAKFSANSPISFVYATAGTDDLNDVINDIEQLRGFAEQYKISASNAVLINKYIIDNYKNASLTFLGHSLGGGLAILNSVITGRNAITFNPASVSYSTLRKDAGISFAGQFKSFGNQVTTYIMRGDPLNFIQDALWPLTNRAQGDRTYVDQPNRSLYPFIKQHSVNNFISAFEHGN